ncbi:amidohydrolase family protein [Bacteroidota bacterium]
MLIDAHQHFWKYNPLEYSWINDKMNVLKRDFLPDDLINELKQLNFNGSIAVQARQSLEETRWLLVLAGKYDFIKGVVGWVDLCSPEVEDQLIDFSRNKKLVGVRHVIHDEPDDKFMERSDFQLGISLLSKYDLTYDLLIFPKHLTLATELVTLFPNQKFVLDHIAKPLIKDQVFSPWDKDIIKLANLPNVYCKLSGLVTEADWKNWKQDDFNYYLDTVFNCFGEDRLMIGSDWPVCTIAGEYKEVMALVLNYIKQFSSEVQNKFFSKNCKRIYQIQ